MTHGTQAPNRLAREHSPYLLQHAGNPVDWYPWSEKAFEKAKAEDKPIFLSIGYSTCHWCHVMNEECFEDLGVAEVLNNNFVSIKVDREERPDVDNLYMDACTAMSGQGGWPLTAILNTDKTPFFAGTYFPRKTLISILTKTTEMWSQNREKLIKAGGEVMAAITTPAAYSGTDRLHLLNNAVDAMSKSFDKVYGGFIPAPKFPALQRILYLLRVHNLDPGTGAGKIAFDSLLGMARGGIFDHVGGGFFRYSTDAEWHIPHYEKMLYDNAMAILTYSEGAAVFGEDDFLKVAESCVNFVFQELGAPEGGFYTALDADSPGGGGGGGGEGAFYLWTKSDVLDKLGQENGSVIIEEYDIGENPSLPNRIGKSIFPDGTDMSLKALYKARGARSAPARDEKVLGSGSALMTAALASAGRLHDRQDWIEKAGETADFMLDKLCVEGRLKSSYFNGRVTQKASLDDYAYFVWALIELYEATFDPKWLGLALNWNAHMLEQFSGGGGGGGGLFLSGRDVSDIPARQKVYLDGPLPSGNAVAASNLIKLYAITKDETYEKAAEDIFRTGSGYMEKYPASCAGLMSTLILSGNIATVTVSPGRGQDQLLKAAGGYRPFLVTVAGASENPETISRIAPSAAQSRPVDGKSAAYYCDRRGCRRPVTEASELMDLLC